MAKPLDIMQDAGRIKFYERQIPDEDIFVVINGSSVTITLEMLLCVQRGSRQKATRTITINHQESFVELLKRAQLALQEAFQEIGEYRRIPFKFEYDHRATWESLSGKKMTDQEAAEFEVRWQELEAKQAIRDARMCPWTRLENQLKTALETTGIILPEAAADKSAAAVSQEE